MRKIISPGSKVIKKEGNKEWQMPLMTAPDSPYGKNTDPVKGRLPTKTQVVEFCRVANSTFEGFLFFFFCEPLPKSSSGTSHGGESLNPLQAPPQLPPLYTGKCESHHKMAVAVYSSCQCLPILQGSVEVPWGTLGL